MKYKPNPINTDNVVIPNDIAALTELLARNVHEEWATERLAQGWRYGETRDDARKLHPCLVSYDELPESERLFDRKTAMQTIKAILSLGYKIEKK